MYYVTLKLNLINTGKCLINTGKLTIDFCSTNETLAVLKYIFDKKWFDPPRFFFLFYIIRKRIEITPSSKWPLKAGIKN